jgi:hypothetical protein
LTFQVPRRSFNWGEVSATYLFYCGVGAIQPELVDPASRTGRDPPDRLVRRH